MGRQLKVVFRAILISSIGTRQERNLKNRLQKLGPEFKELDIIPYYLRGEERKNYFWTAYSAFSPNFSDEDLYVQIWNIAYVSA